MALTTRRLVAIPLLGVALTFAAFGVVRGVISAGPARGHRLIVAIEPPVDDAARTMAAHIVRSRLAENGLAMRVIPAGDQLVVEVGVDDALLVHDMAALLERTAKVEAHTIDATSPWLAAVVAFAAKDPGTAAAGVRVDGDTLVADDRTDEMADADADAIGCKGHSEGGKRRCMRLGRDLLQPYVVGLATRDPALATPADRLVAYGHDAGPTWRVYVLGRDPVIEGRSIRRAEVLDRGVALDLAAPSTLSPGTRLGFVLDGKVAGVATIDRVAPTGIHVQTSGATEDAAIGAALDLVAVVEAGAARPLHVRRQEAFERATGFFPRAWPFLAIAGAFLIVVVILWRRR